MKTTVKTPVLEGPRLLRNAEFCGSPGPKRSAPGGKTAWETAWEIAWGGPKTPAETPVLEGPRLLRHVEFCGVLPLKRGAPGGITPRLTPIGAEVCAG